MGPVRAALGPPVPETGAPTRCRLQGPLGVGRGGHAVCVCARRTGSPAAQAALRGAWRVRRGGNSRPGLLTCLESRIFKSGKSKAGRREVTARGMTSVHQ